MQQYKITVESATGHKQIISSGYDVLSALIIGLQALNIVSLDGLHIIVKPLSV